MKEQTPKMLFSIRGKLYELLINCIPPEILFKQLTTELLRKTDDCLRYKVGYHACLSTSSCLVSRQVSVLDKGRLFLQVVFFAAQFEHRLQQGSKPIFHLEAFLARVMSEYKQWCAPALPLPCHCTPSSSINCNVIWPLSNICHHPRGFVSAGPCPFCESKRRADL